MNEVYDARAVKTLTFKGKEKFFNIMREYIEAKIEYQMMDVYRKKPEDEIRQRLEKAEEEFKIMINYLEWRIE